MKLLYLLMLTLTSAYDECERCIEPIERYEAAYGDPVDINIKPVNDPLYTTENIKLLLTGNPKETHYSPQERKIKGTFKDEYGNYEVQYMVTCLCYPLPLASDQIFNITHHDSSIMKITEPDAYKEQRAKNRHHTAMFVGLCGGAATLISCVSSCLWKRHRHKQYKEAITLEKIRNFDSAK